MTLHLHDTAARAVREFTPITPGQASVYLCGATVQAPPHIGHLRSAVCFDVLIRWLEASGYRVTFCRNVTDIEDKILRTARQEGVPPWIVAERNQRAFSWAYDALGCRPPDVEPRATGHIPEMIVLIRRLIEGGHAYPAGRDVYFDVRSYDGYGALSGQRLDQMRPAEDAEDAGAKRDPRDFTLWKGAKPGEPYWETPWGPGRPGWHLECSAMATKYLGPDFDIHGGGMDLIFPHHENEIAQSRAAGDGFARYWLHNGLLGLAGEKMSKSVGNSLLVTDVLTRVRPPELRYYLVQAHYRSLLEYSEDALEEAAAAYQRIERFVVRASEVLSRLGMGRLGLDGGAGPGDSEAPGLPVSFRSAMDEDLGVPAALAAVHACVRDGNQALAASDKAGAGASLVRLRAMLDVLGLDPLAPHWATGRVRAAWRRRPAAGRARIAGEADPAAAGRGPGAPGLRHRGRDQGRPGGDRRPRRGHSRRPAMGAEALSGTPDSRIWPFRDRPSRVRPERSRASRGRAPAARDGASSRARDRPRPRPCGRATRRSGAPRPPVRRPRARGPRRPGAGPEAGAGTTAVPRPAVAGPAARPPLRGIHVAPPRGRRPAPPRGRRGEPGTRPSSSPGATRWSSRCGPACPRRSCTSVPGSSTTSGSARPSSSPRTAAWPSSRPAPPNSTGSPAARCTRGWPCGCAPTTTRIPTTCSPGPPTSASCR